MRRHVFKFQYVKFPFHQCSKRFLPKFSGVSFQSNYYRMHHLELLMLFSVLMVWKVNRPFYSCLLSDLAFECHQGWRWPCFDKDLCFCCVNQVCLPHKSRDVCVKAGTPPTSLPFGGRVTEQTTVKCSIAYHLHDKSIYM